MLTEKCKDIKRLSDPSGSGLSLDYEELISTI